ncbi:MAG TPA: sigma-70 family RNA polymerase sigma factor [Planctomicrobium sp.]|nr:sigma-70 family RNA polymerase sigma factor [Planctomicrobium sp.]
MSSNSGVNMDQRDGTGSTTQLGKWLESHRNGDPSAQTLIINHACDRLRILASKMLRKHFLRVARWEQTDDVVQQALMRLHRSLAAVHPESIEQLMGLAAVQIRRTLIDLARHHFGPHGLAKLHHTDGPRVNGEQHQQVELQQDASQPKSLIDWLAFYEAVENLPAEEQQVFNYLWCDGLTHLEAAELLGVTERTIRRRWQSARILLHRALGESPV